MQFEILTIIAQSVFKVIKQPINEIFTGKQNSYLSSEVFNSSVC